MARDAHLIRQGNQFYLRLAIPRPIRHLFPSSRSGKPRDFITEPLGRNYDPARVECDRRVAEYRALFARAPIMKPKAVEEELEAIKQRAAGRKTIAGPPLESEVARLQLEWIGAQLREAREARESWQPETWQDPRREVLPQVAKLGILRDVLTNLKARASGDEQDRGETINQAAEAWFAEMQRPDAGVRADTLEGHRRRVRAFVERCGDVPLASVTRAMASDWLASVANTRANRTTNAYAMTMQCLFKSARNRGRFQGENPFEDQRRKAGGEKREPFAAEELHKIFAALPVDIAPAKHSPETALPWVVRIAAYSGMRLEEVCQLAVADVQTRQANGGTVVVFDIHNGDAGHRLKNDSSARAIPMHSELYRAGLIRYIGSLPANGLLFPGLKRRASKGGKIGARLGELFRKRLVALGMKRAGLCFHSLRNTVASRLESAGVSQTDAARVLGHAIEAMTYGTYSSGPGLKRLAAVVEEISYEKKRPRSKLRPQ
jgi:integrase